MEHYLHLNRAKHLAMTGLTLTVCGTVLALHQQAVHADTTQPASTTDQATSIPDASQTTVTANQAPASATTQQAFAAQENNVTPVQTTNADRGNYASLDSATISAATVGTRPLTMALITGTHQLPLTKTTKGT